jgi:hypothetical protein
MILIDIDNCISNDAWRIPLIDWEASDPDQRFHAYHMASLLDAPANLHKLEGAEEVIALTAMPERYARVRRAWLKEHAPAVGRVVMRPETDHRPSVELKRSMITYLVSQRLLRLDEVRAAYDDRPEIIAMYREEFGLPAHELRIHEEPYRDGC